MLFVFMDESGSVYSSYSKFAAGYAESLQQARDADGNFPRYPFLILAAIGIPESHLTVVDDWFRQVKSSYLHSGVDPSRAYEIKGSVLYSLRRGKPPAEWLATKKKGPHIEAQKKIWGALKAAQLLSLEQSVFQLLQRLSPTLWIVVVKQADVYRKHKENTWHPFYWALTYLQQRVVHHVFPDFTLLNSKRQSRSSTPSALPGKTHAAPRETQGSTELPATGVSKLLTYSVPQSGGSRTRVVVTFRVGHRHAIQGIASYCG